jgi:hypothetical protein
MFNALMMEAGDTSEMLMNFNRTTKHNNTENSHSHTCHCENLKSYLGDQCLEKKAQNKTGSTEHLSLTVLS